MYLIKNNLKVIFLSRVLVLHNFSLCSGLSILLKILNSILVFCTINAIGNYKSHASLSNLSSLLLLCVIIHKYSSLKLEPFISSSFSSFRKFWIHEKFEFYYRYSLLFYGKQLHLVGLTYFVSFQAIFSGSRIEKYQSW